LSEIGNASVDQKKTGETEFGGRFTLARDEGWKKFEKGSGLDYDLPTLAGGSFSLIRTVALSLHNPNHGNLHRPAGANNSSQRRMRGSGLRTRKKRKLSSTWLVFSFFFNGYISIGRAIM
jgi:hypothetical protein